MTDCSEKFVPVLNKAGNNLLFTGYIYQFKEMATQKGIINYPIPVGRTLDKEKIMQKRKLSSYCIAAINDAISKP